MEKVRDIVCGMEFYRELADAKLAYFEDVYYFCSERCLDAFSLEPEKYLIGAGSGDIRFPEES